VRRKYFKGPIPNGVSMLISSPDRTLFTIINCTKGTVLAQRAEVASAFLTRLLGLAFKKSLDPGSGMLFPFCSNVHTFGMRFSIDVIFIDSSLRVVRVIESLSPRRFSPLVRGSFCVVEVAEGDAFESQTKGGDELIFAPVCETATNELGSNLVCPDFSERKR